MKWACKLAAKLVLSRLPLPYRLWQSFGLFRHGRMDTHDYSMRVFRLHMERAFPQGLPAGATVLELGPGDSIASAIIARAAGASRVWLVDVGAFANPDVGFYRALAERLREQGLVPPDISQASNLTDILCSCNAEYLTDGLASLRVLPHGCIDFVWSHSVLEHVRKASLGETLRELRRILKPGALTSHNIDFQDHLGGALNNLRFSEDIWESAFFANSGFYTNRVPAVAMHREFREAGFDILKEGFGHWPALPTSRAAMHADFRRFRDEELSCCTSHVLMRA